MRRSSRLSRLTLAVGLLLLARDAWCAERTEPPLPPAERAAMLAPIETRLAALDRAITPASREIALYSRRGDGHLFLAHFAAAQADFEKMIALDADQDAPHWRLGIAYYFTGEFAKSARQFEKYHAYDGRDRENGIWKFLADAKVLGIEPARRVMLVYTRFDREPFPALYELFSGKKSTAQFFADLTARGLIDDPRVMFFANYYAGLHEELHGRRDAALPLLHAAAANPTGRPPGGEPVYMWQVARLHYEMIAARKP